MPVCVRGFVQIGSHDWVRKAIPAKRRGSFSKDIDSFWLRFCKIWPVKEGTAANPKQFMRKTAQRRPKPARPAFYLVKFLCETRPAMIYKVTATTQRLKT